MYYQGQFTQDRMEGKGFLFLKDGRVFSGNFKQDKADGPG
jgi:hypothetical protein